jgi:hypothetical protein
MPKVRVQVGNLVRAGLVRRTGVVDLASQSGINAAAGMALDTDATMPIRQDLPW